MLITPKSVFLKNMKKGIEKQNFMLISNLAKKFKKFLPEKVTAQPIF